jgi:hypothetical protein
MGTGNGGINEIIPWFRQKTTWTAVAGMVAAIGGYFTGEVSIMVCIGSVLGALAIIFGRQGIEKSTYIPDIKDRGEELKES